MRQIDRITLPLPVSSPPLGEYLKAAGLVTETQIQTALQTQKRSRIFFGNALVRQGVIQDATLNFFMKMYQHLDSSLQSTVSADRVLDDMSA